MNEFVEYVASFYSEGGIYDIKATKEEIVKATKIRMLFTGMPFDGDSVDRELVRNVILTMRGWHDIIPE